MKYRNLFIFLILLCCCLQGAGQSGVIDSLRSSLFNNTLTSYIIYKHDTINRTYNNGIKQGKWLIFNKTKHLKDYFDTSIIEEGFYNNDEKNGEWRQFYPEGILKSMISFKNNRPYGLAMMFYKDGHVKESGFWINNRWIGDYDLYYDNGVIQHKFNYGEEGKRNGFSYYYFPNDFIEIIGFWYNGKQQAGVDYDTLGKKIFEENFDSLGRMCITTYNNKGKKLSDTIFDWLDGKSIKLEAFMYDTLGKRVREIIYSGGSIVHQGSFDTLGKRISASLIFDPNTMLFNSLDTLVKRENDIVYQRLNLIESRDQVNKQKTKTLISLSIVGILLVFAFFIFRGYRQKQKANQIISAQKEEVERQKSLVEEKNKDILDSITYAKRLQDAILPPLGLVKQYLPESFLFYMPKDIVAGDFYWMERAGDNILIAAADCTGHGVPGAMVSVVCSNALNRTVKEFKITEPGKILDKVRELVLETFEKSEDNVQDGMDISLCCINTATKVAQWSGAYNSLWYIRNGQIIEVPADKQPIGKVDKPLPFSTHNLNLQKEDTLYLFTDGYADQFGGPKGKKFKYKQLQELLLVNVNKPMEEQKKQLEYTLESWKGDLEQVDDILVIGIRM